MFLLIDGYNLLHVTGIFGRGIGPGTLERSRNALMNFLAESIPDADLSRTTVVFDANNSPPGLPSTMQHRGMTVHFARDYASADEMIEVLIAKHSAPKSLTVVSSDRRIQTAARRRKAKPVGSGRWFEDLKRARSRKGLPNPDPRVKPHTPLARAEVEYWMEKFSEPELEKSTEPKKEPPAASDPTFENPFPPGYGEDLLGDD